MSSNLWGRWPNHSNRWGVTQWMYPTSGLAQDAFFEGDAPTTYNWTTSPEFHGFVGSAGAFDPFERTYTFATTPEFHGFVGSAGVSFDENYSFTFATTPEFHGFVGEAGAFDPLERSYTFATSPEFHGFVGEAGAFDPLENTYNAVTSPEFHGFVGEAGAFDPFERTYTWATSPEFHGFVGGEIYNYVPGEEEPPVTYNAVSSAEFHGFAGGAVFAFAPYVEPKRRRRTGYILEPERQKPVEPEFMPTVYNAPLPTGGIAFDGGGGELFIRQKLPYNVLAIVLGH